MRSGRRRRTPTQAKRLPRDRKTAAGAVRLRLAPASLYVYAADFLKAARLTRSPNRPFRPAQFYLACHAFELGLRAFLSLRGGLLSDAARRAMGHDLGRLLSKAHSLGLDELVQFDSAEVAEISKASVYYTHKVFEYPALAVALRGHPQRPDVDLLLAVVEELLSAIRRPCLAQA